MNPGGERGHNTSELGHLNNPERVNDFRALKKEMLFAINFSATQELDRQLQVEKAKNQALEARLLAVEEKLNVA